MRLTSLLALGTALLASAAAQDEPAYRMTCDDLATIRPADEEIWKRVSASTISMATAIELAEGFAEEKGWEEMVPLSIERVHEGGNYYYMNVICHKTNRKEEQVARRHIIKVAVGTGKVTWWQVVYRLPLDPVRSELLELPSGLQYCELAEGDGELAEKGSRVRVHYIASLLDATIVYDTYKAGFPETFVVDDAPLRGLRLGIQGMRAGGKRKLVLTPELAHGDQGVGKLIPPGATLVFDVELLKVDN